MNRLGISRIDERNRTYIPQEVLDLLPKGDRLSWEIDDKGCICVFMGHERFLRSINNCQPKNKKIEGGEEKNGNHKNNI